MSRGVHEINWVARIGAGERGLADLTGHVAPELEVPPRSAAAPTIERADLGDVPALLSMMAEFNRDEGIDWHQGRIEAALRRLVAEPSLGVVGVATAEGAAHGYFVVTWSYDLEVAGRDAWLTELYVRDGARRRGLGRRLLAAAEAQARGAEARALHLAVRLDNEAARALYRQAGYLQNPRHFLSKTLDVAW